MWLWILDQGDHDVTATYDHEGLKVFSETSVATLRAIPCILYDRYHNCNIHTKGMRYLDHDVETLYLQEELNVLWYPCVGVWGAKAPTCCEIQEMGKVRLELTCTYGIEVLNDVWI